MSGYPMPGWADRKRSTCKRCQTPLVSTSFRGPYHVPMWASEVAIDGFGYGVCPVEYREPGFHRLKYGTHAALNDEQP